MEGRWTRYSDPEEYLRAFKVFDKNGDGVLSAKELRKALTSVGEVMLQEEVDQMFAVADVDKDGKINYKGRFEVTLAGRGGNYIRQPFAFAAA